MKEGLDQWGWGGIRGRSVMRGGNFPADSPKLEGRHSQYCERKESVSRGHAKFVLCEGRSSSGQGQRMTR